jgi:hypothetical protein
MKAARGLIHFPGVGGANEVERPTTASPRAGP